MILAAALLLLVALGLFVGGVLTGVVALYWACVALAAVAALVLAGVRRRLPRGERSPAAAGGEPPAGDLPAGPVPAGAWGSAAAPPARPASRDDLPVQPSSGELGARRARHAALGGDRPPESVRPIDPGRIPPPESVRAADPGRTPPPVLGPPPEPPPAAAPAGPIDGEPPVEEVEVTDLLLVVDLREQVLVVDEHPRYHLPGCPYLAGRTAIGLPVDEARSDGFTPCAACSPDRHLAQRERARRAGRPT